MCMLKDLCCICFTNGTFVNLLSLSTPEFGTSAYYKLVAIAPMLGVPDITYDALICEGCYDKVRGSYDFLNFCMKSKRILESCRSMVCNNDCKKMGFNKYNLRHIQQYITDTTCEDKYIWYDNGGKIIRERKTSKVQVRSIYDIMHNIKNCRTRKRDAFEERDLTLNISVENSTKKFFDHLKQKAVFDKAYNNIFMNYNKIEDTLNNIEHSNRSEIHRSRKDSRIRNDFKSDSNSVVRFQCKPKKIKNQYENRKQFVSYEKSFKNDTRSNTPSSYYKLFLHTPIKIEENNNCLYDQISFSKKSFTCRAPLHNAHCLGPKNIEISSLELLQYIPKDDEVNKSNLNDYVSDTNPENLEQIVTDDEANWSLRNFDSTNDIVMKCKENDFVRENYGNKTVLLSKGQFEEDDSVNKILNENMNDNGQVVDLFPTPESNSIDFNLLFDLSYLEFPVERGSDVYNSSDGNEDLKKETKPEDDFENCDINVEKLISSVESMLDNPKMYKIIEELNTDCENIKNEERKTERMPSPIETDSTYKTKTRSKRRTKLFICNICGKRLRFINHFKLHKKTHDVMKYFCKICNVSFTMKVFLDNHKIAKHPVPIVDKENENKRVYNLRKNRQPCVRYSALNWGK